MFRIRAGVSREKEVGRLKMVPGLYMGWRQEGVIKLDREDGSQSFVL